MLNILKLINKKILVDELESYNRKNNINEGIYENSNNIIF